MCPYFNCILIDECLIIFHMTNKLFLPVSKSDLEKRKWDALDIILITGDAYVDHPSYGTAVIGRVLETAGFKVGIIAQPDWQKRDDFMKLGRPRLFFGISAGNLDSTLSNYTPNKKIRHKDYYSPGGQSGLRPNMATIVYANKVRECYPGAGIVLGGIEASLRRLAHYNYWDNSVRRSILLDAKADILVYGMGEQPILEIAKRLQAGESIKNLNGIRGTVVARPANTNFENSISIPSYEEVSSEPEKFNEAFKQFYFACDPIRGETIIQPQSGRLVVQFPPPSPLSTTELDRIYELPYARAWHSMYNKAGGIPGFEVVKFSIVSHHGCSAECNFCSLYAHQGRMIQSRSRESILREAELIAKLPDFKGTITDIGGPTANLYGARCKVWEKAGACKDKNCLLPRKCSNLKLGYSESISLWNDVFKIPKVKHLFISSGLRYDLLTDEDASAYLNAVCERHVSGHLKVAPEHCVDSILKLMNKSDFKTYEVFSQKFDAASLRAGKKQFLVNYFISAHPGATLEDAAELGLYLAEKGIQPEQIQDFVPLPMTVSACMYYTGKHPFTGEAVHVARTDKERKMQRAFLQYRIPKNKLLIREALQEIRRPDLKSRFRRFLS